MNCLAMPMASLIASSYIMNLKTYLAINHD
jgi:hypothetical protein